MQVNDLVRLEVSHHAVDRFVERGGETSHVRAAEALLRLAQDARPAAVPEKFRRREQRVHGANADLYRSGDWLLVVRRAKKSRVRVLITVVPADGQRRWW